MSGPMSDPKQGPIAFDKSPVTPAEEEWAQQVAKRVLPGRTVRLWERVKRSFYVFDFDSQTLWILILQSWLMMAINYAGDVPAYVTMPPTFIVLWIVVSTWGRRMYPELFATQTKNPSHLGNSQSPGAFLGDSGPHGAHPQASRFTPEQTLRARAILAGLSDAEATGLVEKVHGVSRA